MPKVETSIPSRLHLVLVERAEEEGVTIQSVMRDALWDYLGLTDPKPKKKALPEYGGENMVRLTISLPDEWVWELNSIADEQTTPKRKVSGAAVIREFLRVALDKPAPEPVVRAPRDRDLTRDIIIEEQVEQFNEMRNLRISQEGKPKKKDPEVWERIRFNPTAIFMVNLCRVPGCHNQDLGLHKHAGNQLAAYADEVEAGGRT